MQITDTPEVFWQKCSLDIVGLLTKTSEKNKYLLTFQDELSKYTIAAPIPQQDAMISKSFRKGNYFEICNNADNINRSMF